MWRNLVTRTATRHGLMKRRRCRRPAASVLLLLDVTVTPTASRKSSLATLAMAHDEAFSTITTTTTGKRPVSSRFRTSTNKRLTPSSSGGSSNSSSSSNGDDYDEPTATASIQQSLDGMAVRQEIQRLIQELRTFVPQKHQSRQGKFGNELPHNNKASTAVVAARTTTIQQCTAAALALQLQRRLVDLLGQPKGRTSDGALAQRALNAAKATIATDPAVLAELVCLTIQVWCHCGATEGLDRAETLLWTLLDRSDLYLSDRLDVNTDIFNDALASTIMSVTEQWPGRGQLPVNVLKRMDKIIAAYDKLVRDPSARLDMNVFGVNQILYVCLKGRRADEALLWFERLACVDEPLTPWAGLANHRRPNLTTYNTLLQTLSLQGRTTEIERLLYKMVVDYRDATKRPLTDNDDDDDDDMSSGSPAQLTTVVAAVQPNHFSVMPWITAFERASHADITAGQSAEAAWKQVQAWHAAGWIDLTALAAPLVWNAIGRAWAVQAQAAGSSSEGETARRRLVQLWEQAFHLTTTRTTSTRQTTNSSGVATDKLARSVLTILDPVDDWRDVQAILEQVDLLAELSSLSDNKHNNRSRNTMDWLKLYKDMHTMWKRSSNTDHTTTEAVQHIAQLLSRWEPYQR